MNCFYFEMHFLYFFIFIRFIWMEDNWYTFRVMSIVCKSVLLLQHSDTPIPSIAFKIFHVTWTEGCEGFLRVCLRQKNLHYLPNYHAHTYWIRWLRSLRIVLDHLELDENIVLLFYSFLRLWSCKYLYKSIFK